MPPRPNKIAIFDKLRSEFPQHRDFIRETIQHLLDGRENRTQGTNINFIFQSLSRTERRIFTIIASVIPSFTGKCCVILNDEFTTLTTQKAKRLEIAQVDVELVALERILRRLFPLLEIQYIDNTFINDLWNGYEIPTKLMGYDILLCQPHTFLRLKYDFKGLVHNVRAICFHDVIPSRWYFTEIFALTLRFLSSKRAPPLFYSSPSDLRHIRAISLGNWKTYGTYEFPTLRNDISWDYLVIPLNDWNYYDLYLSKAIVKELRSTLLSYQTRQDIGTSTSASLLVLTNEAEALPQIKSKRRVFQEICQREYDNLEDRYEVISPMHPPENISHADFIFIEDMLLEFHGDNGLRTEAENYMQTIITTLQFLKKGGRVIFFTPVNRKVREPSSLLSALFPIKFNQIQLEIILMFLLFRKTLLKTDLWAIINSIHDKSIFPISPQTLDSLLQSFPYHKKVLKISKGRFTCRSRTVRKVQGSVKKKAPNLPVGETIVRYRRFLKHRIQLFLGQKYRPQIIKTPYYFDYHAVNAAELTKKLKRCPNITYLYMLLNAIHEQLISQEDLESLVENALDHYIFDRDSFSRIDVDFEKYNPYKNTHVDLSRQKLDFTHHKKKPRGRAGIET